MRKTDHPATTELPNAAGKTNKPNLFKRIRLRRPFDRAEREFLTLADQTARQLIDRWLGATKRGAPHARHRIVHPIWIG